MVHHNAISEQWIQREDPTCFQSHKRIKNQNGTEHLKTHTEQAKARKQSL